MKRPKARQRSRDVAIRPGSVGRTGSQVRQPRESKAGLRLRVAAILLAGALTYANSLAGPLILDDRATAIDNASIRDLRNIGAVLAPPTETPVAGRPLVNATFAINYALDGLDVAGYHVVNIAFHLLWAALVFAIVRRTMTSRKPETRLHDYADDLAFASALIWVVHPLNSEVVNYLSQRSESLLGVFYLLPLFRSTRAADGGPKWGGQ